MSGPVPDTAAAPLAKRRPLWRGRTRQTRTNWNDVPPSIRGPSPKSAPASGSPPPPQPLCPPPGCPLGRVGGIATNVEPGATGPRSYRTDSKAEAQVTRRADHDGARGRRQGNADAG